MRNRDAGNREGLIKKQKICVEGQHEGHFFENVFSQIVEGGYITEETLQRIQVEMVNLWTEQIEAYNAGKSSSIQEKKAKSLMESVYQTLGFRLKALEDLDDSIELIQSQSIKSLFEEGQKLIENRYQKLKEEYEANYNMTWEGLYGFNNTYAVIVRKDVADQYNLKTTSDLAAVSDQLVFGGTPDYIERKDGFSLLAEAYGLNFKDVKDIDIGLKYQAIEKGDIDVTNGFTTDAQLGRDDVVVLEDDKHLQVNYLCSTVVRKEALEEYPGLEEALMKMDGILTDKEMAGLNYQVEVEGKDEALVARDYLVSKGIIKE